MMLPSLRGGFDTTIKPSELNLHLTHVWFNGAPLLADDFYRACIGTDLNWQALTVYWHVRNNFGRNRIKDTFGFEWGGSPEEEAINATIHVQELTSLKQLPGEELFWGVFERVWGRWEKYVEFSAAHKAGQPLPPPPAPEKPTPKRELPTVPNPNLPKPPDAPKPEEKSWKKPIVTFLTLAVTGLSVASFFVPALAPVKVALKVILDLLLSIGT